MVIIFNGATAFRKMTLSIMTQSITLSIMESSVMTPSIMTQRKTLRIMELGIIAPITMTPSKYSTLNNDTHYDDNQHNDTL